MTAFGGIFRSPALEGVEGSDENGERGRILGLDLDSGVVRIRPARPAAGVADEPGAEDGAAASDPPGEDGSAP